MGRQQLDAAMTLPTEAMLARALRLAGFELEPGAGLAGMVSCLILRLTAPRGGQSGSDRGKEALLRSSGTTRL
jgi:hypothetical protein